MEGKSSKIRYTNNERDIVAHESIQTPFENNFFKIEPNGLFFFFFEKLNFEKIAIVRNCEKNSKGNFLQCFYLTV